MGNQMAWLVGLLSASIIGLASAQPQEYFVDPKGEDTHSGTSLSEAFASVQKGLDALKPGDTLTPAPGEYFGQVMREGLGNDLATTTIRALIPGTAILRGDVLAPEFAALPGTKFVYVADFDLPAQAILEVDTLRILEMRPSPAELEFNPGSMTYDASAKKLYLSTSDFQPPTKHHYRVPVTPGSGMRLISPRRVVIDGLVFTGYNDASVNDLKWASSYAWGLILNDAVNCTIRNCVAYLNASGISIHGGESNVIELCEAYGSASSLQHEAGGIMVFGGKNDVIRHCTAYLGNRHGIRFYIQHETGGLLQDNLVWGVPTQIKGGPAATLGRMERCVSLGDGNVHTMTNSIVGRNHYIPSPGPDSIVLNRQLDSEREFADPANLDFRLQADSSLRGTGPEGRDPGPFPFQADVLFVDPSGADENSGLSSRQALPTLASALQKAAADTTIYLNGGQEHGGSEVIEIGAKTKGSVSIRGRGEEPAVIHGDVLLDQGAKVEFVRIHFTGNVRVQDSRDIQFDQCTFARPLELEEVTNGRLSGCVLAGPLLLTQCSKIFLTNNIFASPTGPGVRTDDTSALLFADYNAYPNGDALWQVGKKDHAWSAVQSLGFERHGLIAEMKFDSVHGFPVLADAAPLAGRGLNGKAIGRFRPQELTQTILHGPVLHSVSETTANWEWWSSQPCEAVIAWGDTPECANQLKVDTNGFASISLNDLQPGREYFFQVREIIPTESHMGPLAGGPIAPDNAPLPFRTRVEPLRTPSIYYVAPDGNNANDGLSRESAWRTIGHAADSASTPGDTVVIAEGTYHENVRVRATGTKGKPIRFLAAPGERVVIDGSNRKLSQAFVLSGKHFIQIDGLYFGHFAMAGGAIILVNGGSDIAITRCLSDGRGTSYQPFFLKADGVRRLLMENCVVVRGKSGIELASCHETTLRHNVFLQNMIVHIRFSSSDRDITVENNIFTDNIRVKMTAALLDLTRPEGVTVRDNNFFLRMPYQERENLLFHSTSQLRPVSVQEKESLAKKTASLFLDPEFAIIKRLGLKPDADQFVIDLLMRHQDQIELSDFLAANPILLKKGIGLQPAAVQPAAP